MPTTRQVTTSLSTYIPRGSNHQPPDGERLRDSHGGSSLEGDPHREPPFNPPVGSFGWPTPDLHMFIQPWYQPLLVQLVSEPATKLRYRKLQYPTYVKDAHIRVFKKAIKINGEIVEFDIINLFSFTPRVRIFEWGENYVQDYPNCTFEKLEQAFCKRFRIMKNDEEVYMQLQNIQH